MQKQDHRPLAGPRLFDGGECAWRDERLSRVMTRETSLAFGQAVNASTWRHMAIAIDRRHLRAMGSGVLRPASTEAQEVEEVEDLINDLQASHSSLTADVVYANQMGSSGSFTDATLSQFRRLSLEWHRLAGLDGSHKRNALEALDGNNASARRVRRKVTSEANLQQALQSIHGEDALPRSSGQWEAIQRMAEGVAQMVVILPTGGGKSLMFQLASVLPNAGVTVVILPLVVLHQDLQSQCSALGLSYDVWETGHAPDNACGAPLLLVSVESACSKELRGHLLRLQRQDRLDRIVLDEAHMVLTDSSYRELLRQVCQVRRTLVPFLALTATLPPSREAALSEALFLDHPLVMRQSVDRPNLRYRVYAQADLPNLDARQGGLLEAAAWMLQIPVAANNRSICYVRTRDEADALASLVGCASYHAGNPNRAAVYRDWIDGVHQTIVGTTALSAGVDFPRVRLIVHVGNISGAMSYSQEIGRAGRDNKVAACVVLLSARPQAPNPGQSMAVDPDRAVMQDFLSTKQCRRQVLTAYLDGGEGRTCTTAAEIDCVTCDNCDQLSEDMLQETKLPTELQIGDELARETTRCVERQRGHYIAGLAQYAQQCMACLVNRPDLDWKHAFCGGRQSTVALLARQMRKKMHLLPGIGCYSCLNPNWICDRADTFRECQYGETVLQIGTALYCARSQSPTRHAWAHNYWKHNMPATMARSNEQQLGKWLGTTSELYGAPAFRINVIVAHLLSVLPR